MPGKEASHESTNTTVDMVKHTITIPLNSTRDSIERALRQVPYGIPVTMVVDDFKLGGSGQIVFKRHTNINL